MNLNFTIVNVVLNDSGKIRYDTWSENDTVNNILFCLQKVMDFMKTPYTFGNITITLWDCVAFGVVGGTVLWAAARLMDMDD